MRKEIERILIVRTDRIGDVILTLPMAEVLQRHFPAARISMLIRRYTAELVRNSPFVSEILTCDDDEGHFSFTRLVGRVSDGKFDVVFHTHPRFRFAFITWIARIPIRIGTGYRWYSFLFNRRVYEHRKDAKYHELEYNLHLIRALGVTEETGPVAPSIILGDELCERMTRFLRERGVRSDESLVILHPGSGGSARNWSPGKFGALAKLLSEVPGVRVIITGGRGEDELVGSVVREAGPRTLEFVNTFSLMEFAAIAGQASLFVANSTGPLHIAAAVGTPVIGFYPQHASLSAARWGPYTKQRSIFTPKDKSPDCHVCISRPADACECMESIQVNAVFECAIGMLRGGGIEESVASGSDHAKSSLASGTGR